MHVGQMSVTGVQNNELPFAKDNKLYLLRREMNKNTRNKDTICPPTMATIESSK